MSFNKKHIKYILFLLSFLLVIASYFLKDTISDRINMNKRNDIIADYYNNKVIFHSVADYIQSLESDYFSTNQSYDNGKLVVQSGKTDDFKEFSISKQNSEYEYFDLLLYKKSYKDVEKIHGFIYFEKYSGKEVMGIVYSPIGEKPNIYDIEKIDEGWYYFFYSLE